MQNITLRLLFIVTLFTSFSGVIAQERKQNDNDGLDTFIYTKLKATKSDTKKLELKGSRTLNEGLGKSKLRAPNYDIIGTEGFLSVSSTGGANYEVPIEVPPGIKGVQPAISLGYNSQEGNGIAGYGWNINGISVITRIPSSNYHDGVIDGIDFDNLDRFALDGQRLILKSGNYGANGAIYQTENYSNIKVESKGTSTYGPSYFIVQYPDGSKAYYGWSSDSRSPSNYAISFWEDHTQGMRINYEYEKANNSQSIKKIRYGSRFNDIPINEIRFTYAQERARYEQAYIANTSIARTHLLSKIEVFGSGVKFRTYDLDYNTSRLNYQRLDRVTETSGDGLKTKAPINFDYPTTSSGVNYEDVTAVGLSEIEKRNAEVISFDITGNSEMDFLVYPKDDKDKFWLFKNVQSSSTNTPWQINTGFFESIFPTTMLNDQDLLLPGQGLTIVQNRSTSSVDFKTYSNGVSSPIFLHYVNTWTAPTYTTYTSPTASMLKRVEQQQISGDFDGDGLTEALSVGKPYSQTICFDTGGGPTCNTTLIDYKRVYLHSLGENGSTSLAGHLVESIDDEDRLMTGDFNGDGKTDMLHIKDNKFFVYTIDSSNNLQLLWQTVNGGINLDTTFLLGDYNGDGKTDILNPTANNSVVFGVYISTGTQFSAENRSQPFRYKKTNFNGNNGILSGYDLVPLDVNGDGKTDIIDYNTVTTNGSSNGTQTLTIYNNLGLSGTTNSKRVEFENGGHATKTGNLKHFPIPIFLTSSRSNKNLEFASISDRWVTNFHFSQDHRSDILLNNIQSNGITHSVFYASLDPSENHWGGYDAAVYQASLSQETYPNVDLQIAPGVRVVSRLQRSGTTGQFASEPIELVKQYYGYYGATHNLNGRGFLGFKGVAQSNWHSTHGERKFNVTLYDTDLRGAKEASYYQTFDYFFNIPSSNYINKSTYEYASSLSTDKVFKLSMTSSLEQNSLTGAFRSTNYTYDSYNNPSSIISNYNGGAQKQWFTYYNNTSGLNYFVGRNRTTIKRSEIGGESFETTKIFSYSDYFLESINTKVAGASNIIEDFERDIYGNITRKTVTPSGENSRETSFAYDTSGRFLIASTDVEGLITNYDYNNNNGNLEEITNPFGQTTTFLNDSWNRVSKETDYLGNETEMIYRKDYDYDHELVITTRDDEGAWSNVYYDRLHRIRRISEKNLLDEWVSTSYRYDNLGRLERTSQPYYSTEGPTQWTETEFDFYERPSKQTLHTGREINISYNGLSTTVDDGVKTVTQTADGLGNTLSSTDPGGTINYEYFGNGSLKIANNSGVVVSVEQDAWGRKTKLTDPSAGTYKYEYNGFDQLTKEISPKGETTYTYSPEGKLISTEILGDHTDQTLTYT